MKDAGSSEFIPLYAAVMAVLISVAPAHAAGPTDAQTMAEQFAKDAADAEARAKREEQERVDANKKAFDAKRAEAQRRFEEQKKKEAEKKKADAERKAREDREVQLIEDMLKQEDARRLAEENARKAEVDRKAAEATKQAEEQKRLAAEADAKRVAEDIARAAAEQQRLAAEANAKRIAEETTRKAEEQKRLAAEAEAKRVAEETARKAEEQKRLAAEAEAKRVAEETARKAEEQKRLAAEAEAKRVAEETARKAEEQKRLAAEADAKRVAEDIARAAAEQKRLAAEAEAKRVAEDIARAAAVAEAKKAADEIRQATVSQSAEDARRQAEDARLAAEEARLKEERLAAEQREKKSSEQRERQAAAPPAPSLPQIAPPTPPASTGSPSASLPSAVPNPATGTRQARVTLILKLEHPNASDGVRRFRNEYTVDPIACFGDLCYIGRGSSEAAKETTVQRALSPGNVIGLRAGSCNKTLSCIYRNIELPAAAVALQPIDINVINHDYLVPRLISADSTCRVDGTSLHCEGGIFTHEYTAWTVPESIAEKAGPAAIEEALNTGLAKARQAYAVRTLAAAQPKLADLASAFHGRVLDDHAPASCFTTAAPLTATFELAWSSLGVPQMTPRFGHGAPHQTQADVIGNVLTATTPARFEAIVAEEPLAAWRIIRGVEQLRALASAEAAEAVSPPDTLRIAALPGKLVLQVGSAIRARAQDIVAACTGQRRAARYDDDLERRRRR